MPDRPSLPYGRGRRLLRRGRRHDPTTLALVLIALVLGAWVAFGAWQYTRVHASVEGITDGQAMTSARAAGLRLAFHVPPQRIATAGLDLDGRTIRDEARRARGDRVLLWQPDPAHPLAEGRHRIELRVDRPVLGPAVFRWEFTVDDTPPKIDLPRVARVRSLTAPVELKGRVEPGSRLWVGGREQAVSRDGRFTLRWPRPPMGPPMALRAVDRAGNESRTRLSVPVMYPRVRGIHLRSSDWADPAKRREVLDLLDRGAITAVELDVKDEYGEVGYRSDLPVVKLIGAGRAHYDLREAVDLLHRHGAHVIVRLVAFNDAVYAQAAWRAGHHDRVIQTPDGQPFRNSSGQMFLNLANGAVQDYVRSIAIEAADAGADDVLLDYIRRPDGYLSTMRFPGLRGTPESEIVDFLASLAGPLHERGAYLGASVFGIAARAPHDIAQDVPAMAGQLDYIAPMIYPSHFRRGNYDLPNPNADPYTLVARALRDFKRAVALRGIAVVPWLQDFTFGGIDYTPDRVRAQIRAACDSGISDYLLWNARADYTVSAIGPCA